LSAYRIVSKGVAIGVGIPVGLGVDCSIAVVAGQRVEMTDVEDQMKRKREAKAKGQPKRKATAPPTGEPAEQWSKHQVDGQRILSICEKDCSEAHEQGSGFVVFDAISPSDGSSCVLDSPLMQKLLSLRGVFDVDFDTCAFGEQPVGQEGTDFYLNRRGRFRTNILPLAPLRRVCPGVSKKHVHMGT
jgi:hypothetical protein